MLVLDGSQGITYPVTAGSTSTLQASSSKVLQVVTATDINVISTTSTSYSATPLTASITPSSASNKILVFVNMRPGIVASGQAVSFRLYRNGSNVTQLGINTSYIAATGVSEVHGSSANVFVDSPASTSAVTYTVYYATLNSGQLAYNGINNDVSSIALLEIAA